MRKPMTSLLIFLLAMPAIGAPEPSNKFKMGDGTASNKVIEMNRGGSNPQVRWSEADGKLQFSNDGADFKNLGSGGGGAAGVNLLVDSDFDFEASGTTQWTTPSGGTFTKTTSAPAFGTRAGSFDASAGSQVVQSAFIAIPDGLKNQAGLASCFFQTSATDYKLQVYDGTDVRAEMTIAASTDYSKQSMIYTHPGSGSLRLRVISASNAAAVKIDNCDMGGATTLPHSQASLVATMYFPTTASCSWSRSGTSLAAFSTVAACPGPSVEYSSGIGTPLTTDTDLPKVTINSLPAGTYLVTATGAAYQTGGGGNNTLALSDGTTTSESRGVGATESGTDSSQFTVQGVFTYSATGNRTFELFGASSTNSVDIDNQSGNYQTTFVVQRFPTAPVEAYTFDTIAWHVDANISGANPGLSNSSISSYTEITDPGLTMTLRSGSAAATVPCSSTNASTGLTCSSGDEGLGVVFSLPRAGMVEVCAEFTHYSNAANGDVAFQLVETANSSQTIQIQGGSRVTSHTSDASDSTFPHRTCGTFDFGLAGQKTIRLMYEQNLSSVSANQILADADTGVGQRDFHITARYISQQVPTPLLPNIVTSPDSGLQRVMKAHITNGGSCAIGSQSGTWISSVSHPGTGQCTVTFDASAFSEAPACVAMSTSNSDFYMTQALAAPSASSVTVRVGDHAGVAADSNFDLICMGK